MYYLMIKKIDQTGLQYLCKRKQTKNPDDHIKYRGSGKLWRRVLAAHPEYTISTTVLGLYNKEDLVKYGAYYSELYDIVESKEWANLIPEMGDGGRTHKGTHPFQHKETKTVIYRDVCPDGYESFSYIQPTTRVIHNPTSYKMKKILVESTTPNGWVDGGIKGKFSYGPKRGQTTVYHNGSRKIYLNKEDPVPPGFVSGVHYIGTTKGRIGCYNPLTSKKLYIKSIEDLPDGFVVGILPTTGFRLNTPYGEFSSIAECMRVTNLTRHKISRNIENSNEWFYIKDNDDISSNRI